MESGSSRKTPRSPAGTGGPPTGPGATAAGAPAAGQQTAVHGLVGRRHELEVALAVLGAGHHLLLEGPPGVGKTVLALAACERLGRSVVRVDGDDRYAESRLCGWFDPPLVVRWGYREQSFAPGPLLRAMREGHVLFINELDRMPEAAQNVLLPALDERVIQLPSLGEVRAAAGFQLVATRDPGDAVASGSLSEALRDRLEHLPLTRQSAPEEEGIVVAATGCGDRDLVRDAVRLTRATRLHPAFLRGASVRAAIAMVALAPGGRDQLRAAATAALATRVELREDGDLSSALEEVFATVVEAGQDPDEAFAPRPSTARQSPSPAGHEASAAAPVACLTEEIRSALAAGLDRRVEDLDGWDIAQDLTAGRLRGAVGEVRSCAERLAAAAVVRRAVHLVGPLRGATRVAREQLREAYDGELDLEATLENLLGKEWPEAADWVVSRRVERRRQLVLMVDASRSMAGQNMALAAVAAAVLALKVRSGDLALVLFDGLARVAVRLGEKVPVSEVVRRMVARPCGGATDLAIFCNGTIKHTWELALGGNNLTSDLSVGLRTPLQEAEELKYLYGGSLPRPPVSRRCTYCSRATRHWRGSSAPPQAPGARECGSPRGAWRARRWPPPPGAAWCAWTASPSCPAACWTWPITCSAEHAPGSALVHGPPDVVVERCLAAGTALTVAELAAGELGLGGEEDPRHGHRGDHEHGLRESHADRPLHVPEQREQLDLLLDGPHRRVARARLHGRGVGDPVAVPDVLREVLDGGVEDDALERPEPERLYQVVRRHGDRVGLGAAGGDVGEHALHGIEVLAKGATGEAYAVHDH